MIWRRRCLVLAPVLTFLAAALIMSCGGGSSGNSPVAESFRSLVGINVCAGPPPTTTPKPTPTNGHTPTPVPTPICSPIVTSGFIDSTDPNHNQGSFNVQGIFALQNNSQKQKFNDVTNSSSTVWNTILSGPIYDGLISYTGSDGLFIGVKTGCTYFTVSDGGFTESIVVRVGSPGPTPCPPPPGSP